MVKCAICGVKFDGENRWVVCGDCNSQGLLDGSAEMWKIARALSVLYNAKLSEADVKFIADSAAFPWLCEEVLPLVESQQLSNLLKRVTKSL